LENTHPSPLFTSQSYHTQAVAPGSRVLLSRVMAILGVCG